MPDDSYTFTLAWRWTQPTHNVLPPHVMEQIVPLVAATSMDESRLDDIQVASADVLCEEGTKWLRLLPVVPTTEVIVRWGPSTAIQTTWKVFSDYWDDFCYPSSDDVQVYPRSGEWLLRYHHWEQFEWGRRRKA